MTTKIKREELSWLLDLANDMRKEKGDKELEDLPPSVRRDVHSCLIANAFNYGCVVNPLSATTGTISFQSKEDLDTYLKIMRDRGFYVYQENEEFNPYLASLPPELARVAIQFDQGAYYEYEKH